MLDSMKEDSDSFVNKRRRNCDIRALRRIVVHESIVRVLGIKKDESMTAFCDNTGKNT